MTLPVPATLIISTLAALPICGFLWYLERFITMRKDALEARQTRLEIERLKRENKTATSQIRVASFEEVREFDPKVKAINNIVKVLEHWSDSSRAIGDHSQFLQLLGDALWKCTIAFRRELIVLGVLSIPLVIASTVCLLRYVP
jgi:hypothetical protein